MVLSPDLKTGTMAALLKEGWIKPCAMDAVKILFSGEASSAAQFIKREAGMPSGPDAEFGDSSFIASIIMDSLNSMSVRYWSGLTRGDFLGRIGGQ